MLNVVKLGVVVMMLINFGVLIWQSYRVDTQIKYMQKRWTRVMINAKAPVWCAFDGMARIDPDNGINTTYVKCGLYEHQDSINHDQLTRDPRL